MCSDHEDITEILPDYTLPTLQTVTHTARYLLPSGNWSMATVLDFLGSFETITTVCFLPELTENLTPVVTKCPDHKPQSTPDGLQRTDALNLVQKTALLCIEQAVTDQQEGALRTCLSEVAGRETALLVAADKGDTKMMRMLLEAGANVNHVSQSSSPMSFEDHTALTIASFRGVRDAVQILIDAGAELNSHGRFISTPVDGAMLGGRRHVLQALLNAGADLSRQSWTESSLLDYGLQDDKPPAVHWLLDAGADITAQDYTEN